MTGGLHALSEESLLALARGVRSGRVAPPFTALTLGAYAQASDRAALAESLEGLVARGLGTEALACLAEAIAEERQQQRGGAAHHELVWTGPEMVGSASRETRVVAEELFRSARSSILVAGFAVHDGHRVFATLAQRLEGEPQLHARLFLNVGRSFGDVRPGDEILFEFRQRFVHEIWPGRRLPDVFYDPRALAPAGGTRAVLHAKCIVADEDRALVTSANFTEAAQERNIEAGVLVHDPAFVRALRMQFEGLLDRGGFRALPLAGLSG